MSAYSHLTPEELCERLNDCFARTQRPDIRFTYPGKGWYYQRSKGLGSYTCKLRRREMEASLQRFADRFEREEREKPALEAAMRERIRQANLHLAAEDMLAALQDVLEVEGDLLASPNCSTKTVGAIVRAAIAKATTPQQGV